MAFSPTFRRRPLGKVSAVILQFLTTLLVILRLTPAASLSFGFGLTRTTFPPLYKNNVEVSGRIRLYAKKGGKKKKGGGGGGNQKKSGFAWAQDFTLLPFESSEGRTLALALYSSYEGRTGRALDSDISPAADIPKLLWKSQQTCAVVVSSVAATPAIKYANLAALECFGLKEKEFEKFVGAEEVLSGTGTLHFPGDMPKGSKGYESGYTKKVWKSGAAASPVVGENEIGDGNGKDTASLVSGPAGDITIRDATRWVLERPTIVDGKLTVECLGIAYAWSRWTDGEEDVDVDGTRMVAVDQSDIAARVEIQAIYIRKLKEEDGLGNKDEAVLKAVAKLLKLKEMMPK